MENRRLIVDPLARFHAAERVSHTGTDSMELFICEQVDIHGSSMVALFTNKLDMDITYINSSTCFSLVGQVHASSE